jgi:hypothetical protein
MCKLCNFAVLTAVQLPLEYTHTTRKIKENQGALEMNGIMSNPPRKITEVQYELYIK